MREWINRILIGPCIGVILMFGLTDKICARSPLEFKFDTARAKRKPVDVYKTKFLFAFDARNSFALGYSVKMTGLRIGLQIKRIHRFGLGFYSNRSPIVATALNEFNHKAVINFGYSALFYEPIIYESPHWEVSVPVFFGGGEAEIQLLNADNSPIIDPVSGQNYSTVRKSPLTFTGISIAAEYIVWPWIGLGSGIGYRHVLTKNNEAQAAFSSPIYIMKVKIFLNELL